MIIYPNIDKKNEKIQIYFEDANNARKYAWRLSDFLSKSKFYEKLFDI